MDKQYLTLYSHSSLPTELGDFDISIFHDVDEKEIIVVSLGLTRDYLLPRSPTFVRIHSECFTGEILLSLKCDCKSQLEHALKEIKKRGKGLVIYLRQEGRGIGLGAKIKAYDLQEKLGLNTLEANEYMGYPADMRQYGQAISVLRWFSIDTVLLHTNNPEKMRALVEAQIKIEEVIPAKGLINPFNHGYLKTKRDKFGHFFHDFIPGDIPYENDKNYLPTFSSDLYTMPSSSRTAQSEGKIPS